MPRTIFRLGIRLLLIGVIAIGLVFSNYPTAIAIGFAGDERIGEDYVFPTFHNPPEIIIGNGEGEVENIDFTLQYIDGEIDGYTNKEDYIGSGGYPSGTTSEVESLHVRGYIVDVDEGTFVLPNNNIIGPTIRVEPGESFSINVINNLDAIPDQSGCLGDNPPGSCLSTKINAEQFNVTNLHTHGLHVSPDQDDVLRNIQPQASSLYSYDIPKAGEPGYHDIVTDKDHPQGTFWYHPHVHQSTALQTSSGMSGALIIEGGLDEVPEIAAAEENIFVFQQIPFVVTDNIGYVEDFDNTFGPGTWDDLNGTSNVWNGNGGRTTINGQLVPEISMSAGEVQRWRFIHAGVRDSLNLIICPEATGENCSTGGPVYPESIFNEIAEDGIAFGEIKEKSEILLHPGYRSDVLVRIDEPGIYGLIDDRIISLTGNNTTRRVLAKITVGDPLFSQMPLPTDQELSSLAPFEPIETFDGIQEVQFSVACVDITTGEIVGSPGTVPEPGYPGDPNAKHACGASVNYPNEKTEFLVNGDSFNAETESPIESVLRDLQLGQVEEWHLSSLYNPHVFHIHINSFQVIDDLDDNTIDDGLWKDTILIPAYQPDDPNNPLDSNDPNKQEVIIRTRYEDFDGNFVLHCHILDHEDEGMMQIVRICESLGNCQPVEQVMLHH